MNYLAKIGMFVEERHNKIISKVNEYGKVKVKELSEEFGVTEDCIRKDLASIEGRGLIKRTYGGAILVRANVHNERVDSRKSIDLEEKIKIAEKAEQLIKNQNTIFLDISTLNIELARVILKKNRDIVVITNMIEIMKIFSVDCNIKLIFIGGTFSKYKDGFLGAFSIELINRFKFDRAFMGVVGIDIYENNISTYDIEDALTKEAVLRVSKKSYMLTEATKFNRDGNCKFADIEDFTGIITSSKVEQEILNKLKKYNLEILISH